MTPLLFFFAFLLTTTTAVDVTLPFMSSTTTTSSTTTATTSPPPPPHAPQSTSSSFSEITPPFSLFSILTPILNDLGYHDLAMAAHSLSLSSTSSSLPWLGPITIFAPVDSTVRTCPSCSLALLLQERTIPGLYPLDYLRKLTFGTKIETILPGRCLMLTSSVNGTKIYVGGAEVTRPDHFSNGHIIIHGVQGFVSHLSPYSCSIDKMTSLSLPSPSPSSALTRMMLFDAMIRLKTSGYGILALALRVKYPELVVLDNMTIFAVDDQSIFHGGHSYVHDVKFHIVPNRLLHFADLERMPISTILPTLLGAGETLTVTSAGGGGMLSPMRINYVRIKRPDMLYNMKMAVHGLSLPFPHLRQSPSLAVSAGGRSGFHQDDPEEQPTTTTTTAGLNLGRSSTGRSGFHQDDQEDQPTTTTTTTTGPINLGRPSVVALSPHMAASTVADYDPGL